MTSSMDTTTQHDWKPTHPPVGRYSGMAEKMWRKRDDLVEAGMTGGHIDREMTAEMETAAVLLGKVERGETIITCLPAQARQDAIIAQLEFEARYAEDTYCTAVMDWACGDIDASWSIAVQAGVEADLAGKRYQEAMIRFGRMARPEPQDTDLGI